MLGIILGGLASASKAAGEVLARGDDSGGRGIIGMAAQAFHGMGEALGNAEIKGFDIAGVGFGGGFMERMRGALSLGNGAEVAEEGVKLGRSADIHMGRVAALDPYHNDVVVPAAAQSQGVQTAKSASISV